MKSCGYAQSLFFESKEACMSLLLTLTLMCQVTLFPLFILLAISCQLMEAALKTVNVVIFSRPTPALTLYASFYLTLTTFHFCDL